MKILTVRLETDRQDILDLASKMDSFTFVANSQISGKPIYQVDLTTFERILKIKRIEGQEAGIYNDLYNSLSLISTLEDHLKIL